MWFCTCNTQVGESATAAEWKAAATREGMPLVALVKCAKGGSWSGWRNSHNAQMIRQTKGERRADLDRLGGWRWRWPLRLPGEWRAQAAPIPRRS